MKRLLALTLISTCILLGLSCSNIMQPQVTSTPAPTVATTPTSTYTPVVTVQPTISSAPLVTTYSYSNTALHIGINYPPTWTKKEGDSSTIAEFPSFTIVAQFNYQGEANLAITARDLIENDYDFIHLLTQPMTLDQYSTWYLNSLSSGDIANTWTHTVISKGATTLAGYPAYSVTYDDYFKNNYNYRIEDIWTIVNNRVYVVTYTADKAEYNNYLPTIQGMIVSFKIS